MSSESTRHVFGDYELIAQVGHGRSARVYEAIHRPSGDRVAVKLFSPKLTARVDFAADFNAVTEALRKLDHPNILPLRDSGLQQDFYYIVTPFVESRGVDSLLRTSGRLDRAQALGIIEQVASALDYAAQHGIVHGGLTVANLLIDKSTIRVSDFGLAALFSRQIKAAGGGTLGLVGSPNTMAPELATGHKPTLEADRYSLGAVLYELLTGEPPYTADDPSEVLRQHIETTIPSIIASRPDLPSEVDSVIAAAMSKSPYARPNSAGEIALALREALGVEAVIPTVAPVPKPSRKTVRKRSIAAPLTRSEGGVPMWAVMGAAVGAIIVAGLVLLLVGRAMWGAPIDGPTPRPSPTQISNIAIPTNIVTPITFQAPPTADDTSTPAPTPTRRNTFTPRPTFTPIITETPTATITNTPTITQTPRDTFTPGPSRTPVPTNENSGGGGVLATPVPNQTYTPGAVFTLGVILPQTPAPAPFSATILFIRNGQLFAINSDGTGLLQITSTNGQQSNPSRAGQIAFASDRDGNWEIYLLGANGIGVTRLTNHSATDAEPSIAADGTTAFSSTRSGGTDIYTISTNGKLKQVTNHPSQDISPSWSQDGKKIVFASNRDGGDYDLFSMNADGTGLQQITKTSADEIAPAWSPDGSKIAYISNGNVYVLNLATGDSTRLTSSGSATSLSWSVDGTQLVYASSGDLFVISSTGGSPIRITNGSVQDSDPAWAK